MSLPHQHDWRTDVAAFNRPLENQPALKLLTTIYICGVSLKSTSGVCNRSRSLATRRVDPARTCRHHILRTRGICSCRAGPQIIIAALAADEEISPYRFFRNDLENVTVFAFMDWLTCHPACGNKLSPVLLTGWTLCKIIKMRFVTGSLESPKEVPHF